MPPIDEPFIIRTDEDLVAKDVKLHARPFQVALAWIQARGIGGDIMDKALWDPLMEVYRRLYPNGDFAVPPVLVGGVGIRDQLYLVRVSLAYGRCAINPLECIEIAKSELELVYRHYPDQFWRAFYAVCDLWDFGYGADDVGRQAGQVSDLLAQARSSISATARTLNAALDVDAAVQSACLAAELSMKAALAHLAFDEKKLKDLGHRLPAIAEELIKLRPGGTDQRLRAAVAHFPNYVQTRYSGPGLTRVELMGLCMRSQFVAAEAIRRISTRNMAGDMEARPDCPDRLAP